MQGSNDGSIGRRAPVAEKKKRLCKDRYTAMRNLVVSVEAGSYTKAAELLNVSASALSVSITRLEQHLGMRLLYRTTRAMALTPEGETFYALAKVVIALTQMAFADKPIQERESEEFE